LAAGRFIPQTAVQHGDPEPQTKLSSRPKRRDLLFYGILMDIPPFKR
jgi:hypothetical protein